MSNKNEMDNLKTLLGAKAVTDIDRIRQHLDEQKNKEDDARYDGYLKEVEMEDYVEFCELAHKNFLPHKAFYEKCIKFSMVAGVWGLVFGAWWNGWLAAISDPLFHSLSDRDVGRIRRISTHTVRRVFKQWLRHVKVDDPRISAHSARHFAGTASLQAGATIQEVQSLLRHSTLSMVLTYAHNISRVVNAPEPKIDSLLDEKPEPVKEAS